jgi:serine/threonine-protein kinase RsbW
MITNLTLVTHNDYNDLTNLISQANAFFESNSLPDRLIYTANLVMEEILTNIVKYAFSDSGNHAICVKMRLERDCLEIDFEDDGNAFDPLAAPPPDFKDSIMDCEVGGLGIHLVKNVVSSISYRRDASKNLLSVSLCRD